MSALSPNITINRNRARHFYTGIWTPPCRLRQSPVILLTSVEPGRDISSGRIRLPRLSLPRRVRFANRFTRLAPNRLPFIPGTAEDVTATPAAPSQRIPVANATQARADPGPAV
jgi:hypothetical protein